MTSRGKRRDVSEVMATEYVERGQYRHRCRLVCGHVVSVIKSRRRGSEPPTIGYCINCAAEER